MREFGSENRFPFVPAATHFLHFVRKAAVGDKPVFVGENVRRADAATVLADRVEWKPRLGAFRIADLLVDAPDRRRGYSLRTDCRRLANRLERADGFPPHQERYERAGVDLLAALGHRGDDGRAPAGPFARAGAGV